MDNRLSDIIDKDVININTGLIIGRVADIEIDLENAKFEKIVIYGKSRLFGFMGKIDDTVIPWDKIEKIGKDAILVRV